MEKVYFSSYIIFFIIILALIFAIFEIFIFKLISKSYFGLYPILVFSFLNCLTLFILYHSIKGNFYSGGTIISLIILIAGGLVKFFVLSGKFSSNIFLNLLFEIITTVIITFSTFAFERFIFAITSTPESISRSVKENNLLSLRLKMWLGGNDLFLKKPVSVAIQNNNLYALKIFFTSSNDPDILFHALESNLNRNNDWNIIKMMIDFGKENNKSKKECFLYALNYSSKEIKYCLENGYNIKDYPDAILEVIDRHSFHENKDNMEELKQKIDLLISEGADVNNKQNGAKVSPLIFTVMQYPDLKDLIKYLILKGADVNLSADGSADWMNWKDVAAGTTPLMISAKLGHKENIQILLMNGALKNKKDSNGKTAYDYSKKEDLKKMLL